MDNKNKHNSFVLYTSYTQQISLLSDQEAGQLLKALLAFVEKGEVPKLDGALKMCFSFISEQIRRDKEKYEETCKKRAEAGRKGGKQKQANLANATFAKQKQANLADNEYEYDNEDEYEYDNNKNNMVSQADRICALLNIGRIQKSSKGRVRVTQTAKVILYRLVADGFSIEQITETAQRIGSSIDADWIMLEDAVKSQNKKGDL